MTKGQERKMGVAEMKMLRFSLGKTRLDRIENAVIRGRVKVGELVGKIREREQTALVWPFGKTGRQLCRPESPNTVNWKKKERPPKEEVERLHLGRPPRSWRAARGHPARTERSGEGQSTPATPPDAGMKPVEEDGKVGGVL